MNPGAGLVLFASGHQRSVGGQDHPPQFQNNPWFVLCNQWVTVRVRLVRVLHLNLGPISGYGRPMQGSLETPLQLKVA
jgi:hypothetical protein